MFDLDNNCEREEEDARLLNRSRANEIVHQAKGTFHVAWVRDHLWSRAIDLPGNLLARRSGRKIRDRWHLRAGPRRDSKRRTTMVQ